MAIKLLQRIAELKEPEKLLPRDGYFGKVIVLFRSFC
jgi:hypothetical protein